MASSENLIRPSRCQAQYWLGPEEPVAVADPAALEGEGVEHRQAVEPVVELLLADLEKGRAVTEQGSGQPARQFAVEVDGRQEGFVLERLESEVEPGPPELAAGVGQGLGDPDRTGRGKGTRNGQSGRRL